MNSDLTINRSWKSDENEIIRFDYSSNKKEIVVCYSAGYSYKDITLYSLIFDFNLRLLSVPRDISIERVSSNDSNIIDINIFF